MTAFENMVQIHCARRPTASAAKRVYGFLHTRHFLTEGRLFTSQVTLEYANKSVKVSTGGGQPPKQLR